eukprot:scaffold9514_cov106-Cylindrotheca_fusiformis.AAC.3
MALLFFFSFTVCDHIRKCDTLLYLEHSIVCSRNGMVIKLGNQSGNTTNRSAGPSTKIPLIPQNFRMHPEIPLRKSGLVVYHSLKLMQRTIPRYAVDI